MFFVFRESDEYVGVFRDLTGIFRDLEAAKASCKEHHFEGYEIMELTPTALVHRLYGQTMPGNGQFEWHELRPGLSGYTPSIRIT